MSKHTPGPWSIHHAFQNQQPFFVESADGQSWNAYQQYIGADDQIVAELTAHFGLSKNYAGGYPRTDNMAEAKANARLIAAAPELLEALERCVRYLADLNGSNWIAFEEDVAKRDMEQRAKALQQIAFSAAAKAKGEAA